MNDGSELPESVNRAIFLAVVLYFALIAYAAFAPDPIAAVAAEFVFGAIAVGVGIVLYAQSDGTPTVILGAAVCLVAGGALQFAYLFTRDVRLDDGSSLVVFVGVGLYLYAVVRK